MSPTTGAFPADLLANTGSAFATLFATMPAAGMLVDASSQRVIQVNDAFTQLFGWQAQRIVGQPANNFPLWCGSDRWDNLLRKLDQNKTLRGVRHEVCSRNGSLQHCILNIEPISPGSSCLLITLQQERPSAPATTGIDERHLKIFNATGEALLLIDSDGYILEVNSKFERLTGLSNSDCVNKKLSAMQILDTETAARLLSQLKRRGRLDSEEIRVQIKPGSEPYDVLVHAKTVQLAGRTCLVVTARDITAQKLNEKALNESQERLNRALDASEMGVWDWQISSGELHCSPRSAELNGLAADHIEGNIRSFTQHVLPIDQRSLRRAYLSICRSQNRYHKLTYRVLNSDSKERWIEATATLHRNDAGKPVRLVGTLLDITVRRKSEKALVDSEAKFAALFQGAPDPYCLVHSQSRRIIEVNLSFTSTFGHTPQSIVGHTPDEAGVWSKAEMHAPLDDAIRGKRVLNGLIETFATYQGKLLICEVSTSNLSINRQPCVLFSFRDITARKQAEAALRASEDKFARAFKGSPDSISITEKISGKHLEVNDGFTRLTGYSAEEVIGKTAQELNIWAQASDRQTLIDELDRHGRVHHHEMTVNTRMGTQMQVAVSVQPLNIDGIDCILLTSRDVTEQKLIEAKVKHLAYHDALTNLPNRLLLSDRLSQLNALNNRHNMHGALLFFDLDHFKHINDSLGHSCGDAVLQEVTSRLLTLVRAEDTVARLGGDEFVVLLSGLEASGRQLEQEVECTARKLLNAISDPMQIDGHTLQLSASIGVALMPEHGSTPDDLLKRADIALYKVKELGRNGIAFFEQTMQVAASERLAIESELRGALKEKEFVLYYQPQINHLTRAIEGAEALIRWQHPHKGTVVPGAFMHVLEETGLILPVGEWVLLEACCFVSRLLQEGAIDANTFSLSINISPRQFRQSSFVSDVLQAIETYSIPPQCLKLEIIEGIVIQNVADTIDKMNFLRERGVHFAIDDFGTGYSSLSYLKKLPVDLLKIDQSFVRECTSNPNDAEIIRAIIAIASSLRMDLIAEGVETTEQLIFLHELGCDHYQGYLFSPPVDEHAFRLLLNSRQQT
ncbi:EAL domain-containing protein [Pseudomonas neustonica]|uniref:EAL domain-containing protein n=1 Tax=Pseudomonas neustonica TaxID=2487346 RepID=A0ABX9XDS0_9PSED|nr:MULTISPECIES: EAL domain-containing protein [Pseudomonas]ROZ81429.1 EAL domain-containing protein [Pseudomonas neustonica]ROZ82647.1 EAL domain-containing protein [Pseudomonas sp. SSM44]